MSRPLNTAELSSYTHVRSDVLDRTRVRTLPWMPGTFRGITLGRHIFLTTPELDDGTSRLIAHELVHVQQYTDVGLLKFYLLYLADFARYFRSHRKWMPAYRAIRFEAEAREMTAQWLLMRRAGES